jgi:hypothetical protein
MLLANVIADLLTTEIIGVRQIAVVPLVEAIEATDSFNPRACGKRSLARRANNGCRVSHLTASPCLPGWENQRQARR